jgi:SWI/SNF-related matrix-associated actin-dependent regulator 1 of chromatin subfamily A
VPTADRERAKNAFRTDPKIHVFVGNIQSAGEGIDGLQDVCSNMAYAEVSGVPGRMMQSEDRLHRGGQRNSVSINYLLAPGTIDEAFLTILDRRRATINQIMDGVEDVNGESAVMDVWNQLKRGAL